MRTWWQGAGLVAGRALREGFTSKSWRITTLIMALLGLAAVIVPQLLDGGPTQYRLATAPGVPAQVTSALQAGDFEVSVIEVPDAAAAESAVRDGEADVGLALAGEEATLYVSANGGGTFPALVSAAVVAAGTNDALLAAGLTQEQIAEIASVPPPEQVPVGRVADTGRAGIGFAVGIVLYLALILNGTAIATAVATEKTTRISEVLLAVLRPSQLLVGTVLGVGLLGLLQLAALGAPVLIGLQVSDGIDVPAAAAADIALALVWFVLGMSLYAFIFAALATLVEKVTEVGSVLLPANTLLIGSYLIAVIVTSTDPNSPVSVAASLFPLSAPMVMPIRWASGLVPMWQLVLSMSLVAVAAVLFAALASRIYARGLAMTGRRLKLREVVRS